MSIFGIVPFDLKSKISPAPTGLDNGLPVVSIGDCGDLEDSTATEIIAAAEARVLGHLNDPNLTEAAEIVTRWYHPGAAYSLTLTPVDPASIRYWINYSGSWEDRHAINPPMGTTVSSDSDGVLTISGLTAGSRITVEYKHEAAKGPLYAWIKDVVLTLAAVEVARRFDTFNSLDPNARTRWTEWQDQAERWMREISAGWRPKLPEIDSPGALTSTTARIRQIPSITGPLW